MARRDVRLGQLLRVHIDGVPLDLASAAAARRGRGGSSALAHAPPRARARASGATPTSRSRAPRGRMSARRALPGPDRQPGGDGAPAAVAAGGTEWADYYGRPTTRRGDRAQGSSSSAAFLDRPRPRIVWDLGANTGRFSRLAAERGISTVAFDIDPAGGRDRATSRRASAATTQLLPLLMRPHQPEPGAGLGERRADVAARARPGRPGARAGAGPPPRHREQRPARPPGGLLRARRRAR